MKQHKTHSNKLGLTIENSVYEFNDDLIIICIGGLWFPLLQPKYLRGKTCQAKRLIYSYTNPKVIVKIERYRAELIAKSYAIGSHLIYPERGYITIPAVYALYLGVLQGNKSDKIIFDRMQRSDTS